MLQYPKIYQCPLYTNSSKELDYDWYLTKEFDSKELFRHKNFKLLFFVFKISEQSTTSHTIQCCHKFEKVIEYRCHEKSEILIPKYYSVDIPENSV